MEDHPPSGDEADMGFAPCVTMDLTPGSPEIAALAAWLDDLAKKIQTDVTALMAISADNTPASERQRRAYEVVAGTKQRLQLFEKSICHTVTPLDHEVSSPESGAPGLTNGNCQGSYASQYREGSAAGHRQACWRRVYQARQVWQFW